MIFPDPLIKDTLIKRYKRFLADVELEDGEVVLECNSGTNDNLHISVSDTGPSIADDMRDKVFEPFDRLGAESSDISGTGIGLSITKQLIEGMGGNIGFESTVGEGTTFWIEVPLAPAETRQVI